LGGEKNAAWDTKRPEMGPVRYSGKDYLLVNLIVWAILVVVGAITYFGIDRAPVIPFLLAVVGGGFTAVSIYDYLFDRVTGSPRKRG